MTELPTQRDFEDFSAWTGRDVLAPDGDRLGAVELIFLDEATDAPEWVLVRLEDAGEAAFVPLAGASVEEQSIRVDQDRERVAAAPRLDVDETLSVADERRLYEHYGLAYSQQESSTVLPEGAGEGAGESAGATTAAEPTEERPRLRRYVGAPVPPAASDEPTEPDTADEQEADAAGPAATDMPTTTGTGMADPTPAPVPPPTPKAIPPDGGFQAPERADEPSGPLGVLKRRPALPVALAGAIAGLIAVLALRRRR
jgi:hypothetical protein